MVGKKNDFQVPDDMRVLLEKGVTQARQGFDQVMAAAGEAVEAIEAKSDSAQHEMVELRRKSMAFTESSIAAAFDLAQKLVGAKSLDEVMKLQSEYMSKQYETVRGHVQEAGQEVQRRSKAATDEMMAEAGRMQSKARAAMEQGMEAVKDAGKPRK